MMVYHNLKLISTTKRSNLALCRRMSKENIVMWKKFHVH